MEALFLVPVAAAGVVALALSLARAHYRSTAWRVAAQRAGLTNVSERRLPGTLAELSGDADGFLVTLCTYRRGKSDRGTRIVVDSRCQIPASVRLRPEGLYTNVDRTFGGKELEIGDPVFDAQVYVQGPEETLLPLLDEEARLAVLAVAARHGEVTDGTVRIETGSWTSADALSSALDAGLRAARLLMRASDPVARLIAIAHSGDLPAVRFRSLDLLARRHGADPRAREAFRATLRSRSLDLRLRAATALQEEGTQTLLEIAARQDVPDLLAARAVSALGSRLPADRAASILDDAIHKGRGRVALAAVQALALTGGALAVARLAALLAGQAADLALAAAHALGAIGDPAAEAPLVAALASEDSDVRNAAAKALGTIGTAAAVAPLRAAAEAHLLDLGLRNAARQAIATIQARLTAAAPGQVSLADGGAGGLSLASESEAGRVSVVVDD